MLAPQRKRWRGPVWPSSPHARPVGGRRSRLRRTRDLPDSSATSAPACALHNNVTRSGDSGVAPRAKRGRPEQHSAVGSGVLLGQLGGDPAALRHSETLAAGPFTDPCRFTAAARTAGPAAATSGTAPAGGPAGDPDVAGEVLAQLAPVLFAHVDLIGRAVKGEGDRLGARCFVVVQIADQNHLNSLRHLILRFSLWLSAPISWCVESTPLFLRPTNTSEISGRYRKTVAPRSSRLE